MGTGVGQGLWQQMQKGNQKPYNPVSAQDILDSFKRMEEQREIERLMRVLKCYIDSGLILEENELKTITLMITSPDVENRILAETLLEEKFGRKVEPEPEGRKLVLHTGEQGMKMITQLMQQTNVDTIHRP